MVLALTLEKGRYFSNGTNTSKNPSTIKRGQTIRCRNIERPVRLQSDFKSALDELNRNKSARPHRILIDILAALYDFGIDKFMKIIVIFSRDML